MKKTYDLAPNFRGSAHAWSTGFHEKTHDFVYGNRKPFPADDYITVECPRAFYRIAKVDMDNHQIRDFLRRANRMPPKDNVSTE